MSPAFTISPGTLERGVKCVRPFLDGKLVADSGSPLLVWEHPYFPHYAFALHEVEADLVEAGHGPVSTVFGPSTLFDVRLGGSVAPQAATRYPQAPQEALREHVLFAWKSMTTWLEEDEVVHTHPRSPYVRIDALPSSRHVTVEVAGVTVAESKRPFVVFETGAPARYYLPRPDVRTDLLIASDTESHCPYKGAARYWSIAAGGLVLADAVWSYEFPLAEAHRVAGLLAFWPEPHPDLRLLVDGVRVGS